MEVDGEVSGVAIRHRTLVPGWGPDCDCGPQRPTEPSLDADECPALHHGRTQHRRLDSGRAQPGAARSDAGMHHRQHRRCDKQRLGGPGVRPGCYALHCALVIRRSTVFGRLEVRTLELGEDSIFMGDIRACKRQQGCVRFCYVTPASRTPRRYECQPDLRGEGRARQAFAAGAISADQRDALRETERLRVEPDFSAVRYGNPAYCQLA